MLLAPGFSGRVIARSGREVAGYGWHSAPGSGACFPDGGGWIYVSNSEVPLVGGVGAIRFDAKGAVVDAYATLTGWPELATGCLEVLADGGWAPVPDPLGTRQPTRHQNRDTRPFSGGASCHYAAGTCWLTTTGEEVLAYDTAAGTVTQTGHAPTDVVARGNEICLLTADGVLPVVRLPGHGDLAGAALSPDGTRLYFSSPRGATGSPADGMTYEVTGPFRG